MKEVPKLSDFPVGKPNDAYAKYFIGQSWLAPLTTKQVPTHNVTFEPRCRNNWHIHHAEKGGGQMLICVYGRGWVQLEGEPAHELKAGEVFNIPPNVKHWHGAAKDSWFQHLSLEVPGEGTSNEWLEPVTDDDAGESRRKSTGHRQHRKLFSAETAEDSRNGDAERSNEYTKYGVPKNFSVDAEFHCSQSQTCCKHGNT